MANTTFKIYGKTLNHWFSVDEKGNKHLNQVELPYRKYNANFELVATGTEDFSTERLHEVMNTAWVYIWDGKTMNKGGHRKFSCITLISYKKNDAKVIKAFYMNKFNAAKVELR